MQQNSINVMNENGCAVSEERKKVTGKRSIVSKRSIIVSPGGSPI
jgi:hypothetical protein